MRFPTESKWPEETARLDKLASSAVFVFRVLVPTPAGQTAKTVTLWRARGSDVLNKKKRLRHCPCGRQMPAIECGCCVLVVVVEKKK